MPSGLCGTGNAVADFLLGYYGQAARSNRARSGARAWREI